MGTKCAETKGKTLRPMEYNELVERAKAAYPELFGWQDELDALMAVESRLVRLSRCDDLTQGELQRLALLPELRKLWE